MSTEFHFRRSVATVVVLAAIIGGVVFDSRAETLGGAAPYLALRPKLDRCTQHQSRIAWQFVEWFFHRFEARAACCSEHQFLEGRKEYGRELANIQRSILPAVLW